MPTERPMVLIGPPDDASNAKSDDQSGDAEGADKSPDAPRAAPSAIY